MERWQHIIQKLSILDFYYLVVIHQIKIVASVFIDGLANIHAQL